MNAGFLVDYKI